MTQTRSALLALVLVASSGALAPMLGGCAASRERSNAVALPEGVQRLAVDVTNVRGSVEVRVNPRAQGALVESNAKVTTRDDFSPEKDRDIVDPLAVNAEVIDAGDGNAVLKVVSTSPRPEAEDQAIDIRITVPRCDGVKIDNRGGLVMVVGASGAHSITNRGGPVEVRTNTPITDPVTLTTTDGNIYYQVPEGSSGAFDLLTMKGECAFRNEVTDKQKETYATRETLATVLNDGGNPVIARTNQGDVRVWIIKDPVGLTRMYKKTIPDFRDLLYQDGSQRYMRNLPDDAKRNTEYERWYNIR